MLAGLALVVCAFGGWATEAEPPPSEAPVTVSKVLIEEATAVKKRHTERLFALPAVVGMGIGGSKEHPGQAVIQVYVERPLKPGERRLFPKILDGVPVEVEVIGRVRALPEKSAAPEEKQP